jgi:hypothetical protein
VSVFSEIRHSKIFLTLTLTLFRPKGPSSPFASPPRNSMGFRPGSQSVVFATASRAAFSDPLKSLLGCPGFGRPKICEIKANRKCYFRSCYRI